ncbi:MAG: DUF2160 domain-containing protein [Pseudomonadales bacterium]
MQWMAWTAPTAIFFIAIGCALIVLTLLELYRPSVPRRGHLPLVTTRGDRFFISLLASAFVHVGWLALLDAPVSGASAICVLLSAYLMRWG